MATFAALTVVAASPAKAENRRAFVTSVTGTGNIATGVWPGASGATVLDKADSVCRVRAAARVASCGAARVAAPR